VQNYTVFSSLDKIQIEKLFVTNPVQRVMR